MSGGQSNELKRVNTLRKREHNVFLKSIFVDSILIFMQRTRAHIHSPFQSICQNVIKALEFRQLIFDI